VIKAIFVSPIFQISLCTLGCLYATSNAALAQVTSDGTVNTQVNQNGNVAEITGGETRSGNLFHSFRDFSVGTGNEAFFNNATDISNIFSRVTGGNISNIDGLIRANGSANLFLINPAGILFGENARLDVGGSFLGSTADSILFEDGEFSATDLNNPPVLTINAPIGLGFRDQPGNITVRGDGKGTRLTNELIDTENALRVNSDKTFALVGGKLNLEGATIKTPGGRIELGSVAGNEQVSFTPVSEGFSLDYAEVQNFQDIQLSKTATVDASGSVAGDIKVQGENLNVLEGSGIEASTIGDSPSQDPPGSVEINAIDIINVDGAIANNVYTGAVGKAAKISISTTNLNLINGAFINASTYGKGDGGAMDITATGDITFDGGNLFGGVDSSVGYGAVGNAGNVRISTNNLTLTNGAVINASTYGQGNAGAVNITATGDITLDVKASDEFPSLIQSAVVSSARGNAGGISISTTNLTNEGDINTWTEGQGNAGTVDITATGNITFDGKDSVAGVSSWVFPDFESPTSQVGNAGDVTISTNKLTLINGGYIDASTFANGNADSINIDANTINISGVGSQEYHSGLFASSTLEAEGNSGSITINASDFRIANQGIVTANSEGLGNGGNIFLNVDNLTLDNASIEANTSSGTGGNTTFRIADSLELKNDSKITVGAFQDATGGNIKIDAGFIIAFPSQRPGNGNDIIASAETGSGGNIDVQVERLFGIEPRLAISGNGTNDFDFTSVLTVQQGIVVNLFDTVVLPPASLIDSGQTTEQACQADRETAAKNGLVINGKGGIPAPPDQPLTSQNIFINGEIADASYTTPKPIETSKGKIQLARGIKVTKDGQVILTPYPTNNAGERIPEGKINCGER
jgi:filamentous hemagglutinin family protein